MSCECPELALASGLGKHGFSARQDCEFDAGLEACRTDSPGCSFPSALLLKRSRSSGLSFLRPAD